MISKNNQPGIRARLATAIAVTVSLATAAFAITFYFVNETLEIAVLDSILENEMQVVRDHIEAGEEIQSSSSTTLGIYVEGSLSPPPESLRGMSLGTHHEVEVAGREKHVRIDSIHGRRAYLAYDIAEVESYADLLIVILSIAVIVMSVAGGLVGWRMAERFVGPVGRLADRLRKLQPTDRAIRLSHDFRGEEVEAIAAAVDRFLERLDGFVEREQSFTSAASHELRTPLAVIRGATEILESHCTHMEPTSKALHRIQRAQDEMSEFITALLGLAREESTGDVDVEAHVDEICEKLFQEFEAKAPAGVRLEMTIYEAPVLRVEPGLLSIVISNLLRNALENTERGKVRLVVNQRSLRVEDTGKGIPDEVVQHIFDRYFTRGASGYGIGLYLVKRIADRNGWAITVSSVINQGTRIELRFD